MNALDSCRCGHVKPAHNYDDTDGYYTACAVKECPCVAFQSVARLLARAHADLKLILPHVAHENAPGSDQCADECSACLLQQVIARLAPPTPFDVVAHD